MLQKDDDGEESTDLLKQQALIAAAGSFLQVQCAEDMFVYDIPTKPRNATLT